MFRHRLAAVRTRTPETRVSCRTAAVLVRPKPDTVVRSACRATPEGLCRKGPPTAYSPGRTALRRSRIVAPATVLSGSSGRTSADGPVPTTVACRFIIVRVPRRP